MCCIIQSSEQIAEEDIICYKVVRKKGSNNCFLSVCQGFPYFLGKRNHTNITLLRGTSSYVEGLEGFHSFCDLKSAEQYYKIRTCNRNIVKCIIPKGSSYYIGADNYLNLPNYLSSDIIIIKEIKFNFKMYLWLLKKRIFG